MSNDPADVACTLRTRRVVKVPCRHAFESAGNTITAASGSGTPAGSVTRPDTRFVVWPKVMTRPDTSDDPSSSTSSGTGLPSMVVVCQNHPGIGDAALTV